MGTRHLTIVVSDGQYKVAQYGQWDGYPSGQGQVVTQFIIDNLRQQDTFDSFKGKVDACRFISDEEVEKKFAKWGRYVTAEQDKEIDAEIPEFSRNTCAKILNVINERSEPVELQSMIEFANDSLFCEWAWLVNLDNKTLEVFKGFNISQLSENERFYSRDFVPNEGFYPIRLLKVYKFEELTDASMTELEESLN